MSQSWINVGINWTRVAFLALFKSPFFSFFSPLLWSVCFLAGYQSGAVSPSAGFPEWRGVPPHLCPPPGPDQRVLDQRTFTNTGRKQRSLDSMKRRGTVETSGSTRKREKKKVHIEGQKITSLLWLYTDINTQFPKYSICTVGYNTGGKALACNPCAHVRKSEFPGMLF